MMTKREREVVVEEEEEDSGSSIPPLHPHTTAPPSLIAILARKLTGAYGA